MVDLSLDRLKSIIENGSGKQILVVGDLMLDRYLWGNVSRISPEAPVPIINISDDAVRFGGAANVANNLIALNARPILVGTVGDDDWGATFRKMLQDKDLPSDGLITDPTRPTSLKTRIIGNNQHIARVDHEKTNVTTRAIRGKMLRYIEQIMPEVDAVILQDYNKGVLTPSLVEDVVQLANAQKKVVTVDPKFDNFLSFRNVTVFKPNRKETEEALAIRLDSEANLRKAGLKLLEKLNAVSVLITLGEKGMALFDRNGELTMEGTRARKVADVSGAGDTVIATLTFALSGGATLKEAVAIANHAAGVVCEEVGAVPIHIAPLIEAIRTSREHNL